MRVEEYNMKMRKFVVPVVFVSLFPGIAFACMVGEQSISFVFEVLAAFTLFYLLLAGLSVTKYLDVNKFMFWSSIYLFSLVFALIIFSKSLFGYTLCMTPRDGILKLVYQTVPLVSLLAFYGLVLLSSAKKTSDEVQQKMLSRKIASIVIGLLAFELFLFGYALATPDGQLIVSVDPPAVH